MLLGVPSPVEIPTAWWMLAAEAPPADVISPIASTGVVGAICIVLASFGWWSIRLQRRDLEEARVELKESQAREREAYQATLPALEAASRALSKAQDEVGGRR